MFIQVALADVTELTALENEAVEVFLEEEEREREVLKQALNVRENRGKAFMRLLPYMLHGKKHIAHVHAPIYITYTCTCTFIGT